MNAPVAPTNTAASLVRQGPAERADISKQAALVADCSKRGRGVRSVHQKKGAEPSPKAQWQLHSAAPRRAYDAAPPRPRTRVACAPVTHVNTAVRLQGDGRPKSQPKAAADKLLPAPSPSARFASERPRAAVHRVQPRASAAQRARARPSCGIACVCRMLIRRARVAYSTRAAVRQNAPRSGTRAGTHLSHAQGAEELQPEELKRRKSERQLSFGPPEGPAEEPWQRRQMSRQVRQLLGSHVRRPYGDVVQAAASAGRDSARGASQSCCGAVPWRVLAWVRAPQQYARGCDGGSRRP